MTREEARNRLEGTWNFEVNSDLVFVQDADLLAEIALLSGAQPEHDHTTRAHDCQVTPLRSYWSAAWRSSGEQLFN